MFDAAVFVIQFQGKERSHDFDMTSYNMCHLQSLEICIRTEFYSQNHDTKQATSRQMFSVLIVKASDNLY